MPASMGVWGVDSMRRCHSVVLMCCIDCYHCLQQESKQIGTEIILARKGAASNKHDIPTIIANIIVITNNIYLIYFEAIRCIFELKSLEYGDFNDKISGFDFTFELEYELEWIFRIPTIETIRTMPHTLAPAFNSTPTGVGSCQTSVIGCDLIDVLSAITIATTKRNKNENELKYNIDLSTATRM